MLFFGLFFVIISINSGLATKLLAEEANIADFPYQVSLRQSKDKIHICGGAILNESFVLTAAHCLLEADSVVILLKPKDFLIVVGQTELTLNPNSVIRNVKKIIEYPFFNSVGDEHHPRFQNDLALLELEEKLSFTKSIQPVKLNDKEVVDGLKCTMTGWGTMKTGKKLMEHRKVAETLKKDVYSTITGYECSKKGTGYTSKIPHQSFCTEGTREEAKKPLMEHCQLPDDNGGPLVCNGLLTGIVSSGTNHMQTYHIAMYTDIPLHLLWIQNLSDKLNKFNKHEPKDKNYDDY